MALRLDSGWGIVLRRAPQSDSFRREQRRIIREESVRIAAQGGDPTEIALFQHFFAVRRIIIGKKLFFPLVKIPRLCHTASK
jgi:hypothetical protein